MAKKGGEDLKKTSAEKAEGAVSSQIRGVRKIRQLEESAETKFYETSRYRCLVYREKQTDDIYMTLCGIEQCVSGYRFITGDRPAYHLHTILSGKGTLCVEGQETELKEGQMFLTKPGEEAWYRADDKEPWQYCWIAFDGNLAEKYVMNAGFGKGINYRNCQLNYQRYANLVKKILDKPEMTLANDIHRLAVLLEYIAYAVEDYQSSVQGERRGKTDYTDSYVEYALNYIRENFATAKVSDVAHNIGIHRSYLTSIFRKKLGISPQEYMMRVKLERARLLLLNSNAPVQEVSQMVGYENPLTFSKCFKNRYGMSPRAFRIENAAKEE